MDQQPEQFAGYEALASLLVGLIVGCGLARTAPSLAVTGRWIWAMPVAFVLPDVLRGVFRSPVPSLSELLFASTGEGLGVFIVTFPVCSIVGYSLGMAFVFKLRRVRLTAAILIGATVICVLALAMHAFEMQFLERWSKIRTVVQSGGIQVVQNAGSLCEDAYSGWTSTTLPITTHVEVLGRVFCDGNRIVAPDNLPAPAGKSGTYFLLHVRVLDGPSGIKAGWTMEAGLKESRLLHN